MVAGKGGESVCKGWVRGGSGGLSGAVNAGGSGLGAEDGGGRKREMSDKITIGKGEGGKVCVGWGGGAGASVCSEMVNRAKQGPSEYFQNIYIKIVINIDSLVTNSGK